MRTELQKDKVFRCTQSCYLMTGRISPIALMCIVHQIQREVYVSIVHGLLLSLLSL